MLKAFAGGFNFAHLSGLATRAPKADKTEKDLRDQHDAEATAAAAETEECEDEDEEEEAAAGGVAKAGKKAKKKKPDDEEDEDETSEGEEDGDDEDEDQEEEAEDEGKRGKKAAAAAPKPAAKSPAKSAGADFKRGRKAERRRIGLILSHKAASANLPFAAKLACNTGMSSSAAIALLEQTPAVPAARGGRLDRQMADTKVPDVNAGAPEAPKGEAAISASWDVAMKSAAPVK